VGFFLRQGSSARPRRQLAASVVCSLAVVAAVGTVRLLGCGSSSSGRLTGSDGQIITVLCDPVPQTGCAAGEKCNLFCGANGPEFGCRPDQGMIGSGKPCVPAALTGEDKCSKGMTCASTTQGMECTTFCAGDAGCGSGRCVTVQALYPCFSDATKNRPFSISVCQ
jgi:hypothetical protein